jgi:hypothetical protein
MRPTRRLPLLAATALVLGAGVLAGSAGPTALAADPFPIEPSDLQFSATIVSDPQRDEGEPAITPDRNGNIYTCGPTGFSTANDYAQISTDGGDQFHLLGTAPRGQIAAGQGGGDCALATAVKPNAQGNYNLAYAGLGPLTNFSTATSADNGRSFAASATSESVPGVDRQWIAFSDDKTAFLTYNQLLLDKIVQKSTDGGLTYDTPGTLAAAEAGRIGQIRAFLPPGETDVEKSFVYFPYSAGNLVKIALSQDNGATWSQCVAVDAEVPPTAGFVAADNDDAGNVYVTYTEKGEDRATYLVGATFEVFKSCKGPNPPDNSAANDINPGFTQKIRMNRGSVKTTVMPWVAASGAPGRAAVAYYGTDSEGDPDSGEFDAAWYVYVNQVLDVFADTPKVSQVQASTHPTHYDSICLNGLGCTIAGADRSLVDYFTMEYNRGSGALNIVYSNAGKKPDDVAGVVATPSVLVQIAGPSNGGGKVSRPGREVLRQTSPDPAGDAFSSYSFTSPLVALVPGAQNPVDALDLVDRDGRKAVEVLPREGGGFVVEMRFKDLSDAALQDAILQTQTAAPGSLVYAFRFLDGFQSAAAVARWDVANGWFFGYNGYTTTSAACASNEGKCLIYPGTENPTDGDVVTGEVDQAAGVIRLDVPIDLLKAYGPLDEGLRPTEVPAKTGDRVYDATAFAFLNPSPDSGVQSFMEHVDNAPAMDFIIGARTSGPITSPPVAQPPAPTAPTAPRPTLPSTGVTTAVPLVALGLLLAAASLRRRPA